MGNPTFHHVTGSTLDERIHSLRGAAWGGSTDFAAVFRLILNRAKQFKLADKDLPKQIIVLSDMEFRKADNRTNFEYISKQSIQCHALYFGTCDQVSQPTTFPRVTTTMSSSSPGLTSLFSSLS